MSKRTNRLYQTGSESVKGGIEFHGQVRISHVIIDRCGGMPKVRGGEGSHGGQVRTARDGERVCMTTLNDDHLLYQEEEPLFSLLLSGVVLSSMGRCGSLM